MCYECVIAVESSLSTVTTPTIFVVVRHYRARVVFLPHHRPHHWPHHAWSRDHVNTVPRHHLVLDHATCWSQSSRPRLWTKSNIFGAHWHSTSSFDTVSHHDTWYCRTVSMTQESCDRIHVILFCRRIAFYRNLRLVFANILRVVDVTDIAIILHKLKGWHGQKDDICVIAHLLECAEYTQMEWPMTKNMLRWRFE